jgi:hypothetical protein
MLNIHMGSTEQGRSIDVGIQDGRAAVYIGREGNPGGPATFDPLAMKLSIYDADHLGHLLDEAAHTAQHELAIQRSLELVVAKAPRGKEQP